MLAGPRSIAKQAAEKYIVSLEVFTSLSNGVNKWYISQSWILIDFRKYIDICAKRDWTTYCLESPHRGRAHNIVCYGTFKSSMSKRNIFLMSATGVSRTKRLWFVWRRHYIEWPAQRDFGHKQLFSNLLTPWTISNRFRVKRYVIVAVVGS